MILTLSKEALLSAMIFQAKKDVRYYLNGICFAPIRSCLQQMVIGYSSVSTIRKDWKGTSLLQSMALDLPSSKQQLSILKPALFLTWIRMVSRLA